MLPEAPREWLSAADLIADVRRASAQILPEHMIPARFGLLPVFPRTPSGKLDSEEMRRAARRLTGATAYVAPRTPIEAQLAEIWRDHLGVGQIGVTDNFFHLGGHSLLVIQIVAAVGQRLGTQDRIADFFAHPTIEEQARRVATAERTSPSITRQRRPWDVLQASRSTGDG